MKTNQTYKLILLAFFLSGSTLAFSQTTYRTGFDTDDENKGWVEFRKGKMGNAQWKLGINGYSEPNCMVHSAPTGDADKDSLVNWFVSPKFDFSNGGTIDTLRYNYYAFMGTFFPEQVVQVYALNGSNDPAKATSKVLLADFAKFFSDDITKWNDTSGFAIPKLSGDSYIAFKFVATDGWSSIAFDDLQVTTNANSTVEETATNNRVNVFPNPTNGNVLVVSETKLNSIQVINGLGQIVKTVIDTSTVDLSELSSGIYRLVIKDESDIALVKQVVLK